MHGTVVARRGDVTATGARLTDGTDATAPQTDRVLPTGGSEATTSTGGEETTSSGGKKKKR